MEHDFWHERWASNEIAFHEGETNALLVKYIATLGLRPGSRIFLPLCGKTNDIAWLLANGYRIVGSELSDLAIQQLFEELDVTPAITDCGNLKEYRSQTLDIFVGDFFELNAETLGDVDAVYDRAALVALPSDMRGRYAAHLMAITANAQQLLICFEYDQTALSGPPFSVDGDEITKLYGHTFYIALLDRKSVPGGLKKKCTADETAWRLERV